MTLGGQGGKEAGGGIRGIRGIRAEISDRIPAPSPQIAWRKTSFAPNLNSGLHGDTANL